jgi:NTE family protein
VTRPISLVLGSGGARGLAHIGAIRCLEEHGYEIRCIAGSSMGALIGGIYAAGKLDVYAEWVRELQRRDIMKLLDWSFSRGAVFGGDRIIAVLEEMIGKHAIEDLEIRFIAVATEINEQREVWLRRGSLFEAIRASIAMPLVFAPVRRDGMLLVDGGLINPVPIAPTLNDDSAMIVAIDLNARAERLPKKLRRKEPVPATSTSTSIRERIAGFIEGLTGSDEAAEADYPSSIELGLNSIDTMQSQIARLKMAAYAPGLIVPIPRNVCTIFEFHRAAELIDFGYERTRQALESQTSA